MADKNKTNLCKTMLKNPKFDLAFVWENNWQVTWHDIHHVKEYHVQYDFISNINICVNIWEKCPSSTIRKKSIYSVRMVVANETAVYCTCKSHLGLQSHILNTWGLQSRTLDFFDWFFFGKKWIMAIWPRMGYEIAIILHINANSKGSTSYL